MRVDSRELPLSAIPLCQLLPCHFGPPRPTPVWACMSKAVLIAPLERSTCPYHRSLLSVRMRSRSSMPSCTSSSSDLVVTMSCGLTLQICLIIALSFRCRRWRFGFVNGQVSLAWSIALRTQEYGILSIGIDEPEQRIYTQIDATECGVWPGSTLILTQYSSF